MPSHHNVIVMSADRTVREDILQNHVMPYIYELQGERSRLGTRFVFPEHKVHPVDIFSIAESIVENAATIDDEYPFVVLTYSPYVIEAMEVASANSDEELSVQYVLIETDEDGATAALTDVSNELERIYAPMAQGFQNIETARSMHQC